MSAAHMLLEMKAINIREEYVEILHHSPNLYFRVGRRTRQICTSIELLMNFITVPFSTPQLSLIPFRKLKMSESSLSLSGAVKFCKRIVPSSSFVHSRKMFYENYKRSSLLASVGRKKRVSSEGWKISAGDFVKCEIFGKFPYADSK